MIIFAGCRSASACR